MDDNNDKYADRGLRSLAVAQSFNSIYACSFEKSTELVCALYMMTILRIPKVAVELKVDQAHGTGSKCEILFLANEGLLDPTPVSNIERLISGFEDHVLSHGNTLDKECRSCFSSSMADCLTFVSNGSKVAKPEGGCCNGLKTILKADAECLCEAFKSSAQLGVVLNVTKATTLPSTCGVNAPSLSNY